SLLRVRSLPAREGVQRGESRIRCRGRGATARSGVQVRPAPRAKTPTPFSAQRTGREREDDLLVDERREIDLLALVVAERHVLGRQASAAALGRTRCEHEDERMVEPEAVLLEAAGAGPDHVAMQRAPEEDVQTGPVVLDVDAETGSDAVVMHATVEPGVQLLHVLAVVQRLR